jgi:hypothetical protein
MNTSLHSSRAATPASLGFYFTQDSRTSANAITRASLRAVPTTTTVYGKVRSSRVPYASALYAAAVAALLSGCMQSEVERVPDAQTIHLSETPSDLPEVVITASRERPKANG